jgi:hypothetical protein
MLNDVSKSVPMQKFFRANLPLADGVVAPCAAVRQAVTATLGIS